MPGCLLFRSFPDPEQPCKSYYNYFDNLCQYKRRFSPDQFHKMLRRGQRASSCYGRAGLCHARVSAEIERQMGPGKRMILPLLLR